MLGAKSAWAQGKIFVDQHRKIYLSRSEEEQINNLFHEKNKLLLTKLYRYCVKEFSAENIFCALAVHDYQNFPTFVKSNYIYKNFISDISFNTSAKTRRNIKAQYQLFINGPSRSVGGRRGAITSSTHGAPHIAPPIHIFKELYNDAIVNICDTYTRFLATEVGTTSAGMRYISRHLDDNPSLSPSSARSANQICLEMRSKGFHIPNEFLFQIW